ncbi:hypothetical protein B0H14DRAFT_2579929 [Mycena olivaceomarginata]|nr:hypothetical protein B0H14DRAFT_2579929 [Mycena olivaceomarginata]
MAANWGVKGWQGAVKGWQWGGTGQQGGITGGITFEGGGRQSNYGGGGGGRQLCVTGDRCDMLAPSWRQVGSRSNQGGINYHRCQLSQNLAGLLAQHLFHIAHLQSHTPPHISLPFSIKKDLIAAMHLLFITISRLIGMVRIRPDPRSLCQLELRAHPTEAQELSRDVSPDMPPQSHESRPTPALDSIAQIPFSWDFWPDGQFQSSVSPREIADTHKLATNWVLETPNGSLGFVDYEPKYTVEPVHSSVAASSHPLPDASEDGSNNESTASWCGIYSKNSIWFKTLTDQSCKEGKQVNVSMDDMFSEAEESEVEMDAEADENEEGILEDEEEWEVQRDPEANESEEGNSTKRSLITGRKLIVEIGDILEGHHWNIPKSLAAYANKPTACAHGVNYTIAAHLYTNPSESHFIARYSSDMTHVYDYDRREHDGDAVFNVANMKSLTGLSDSIAGIPDGYHLTAVVYHLDGGEGAQRYFCQEQVRLANRMGLHFEGASGRIPSSYHFGFQMALQQSIMLSPLRKNHRTKEKHQELVFTDRTASFPSVPATRSTDGILQWPLLPWLVQVRGQAFLQLPPFHHLHTKPALQGTLKYFGSGDGPSQGNLLSQAMTLAMHG